MYENVIPFAQNRKILPFGKTQEKEDILIAAKLDVNTIPC